jgi:glycosyltransferase involved in cell wall biosynthesis
MVTPSYNQGNFIKRTIDSVLGQKYTNIKYIVQDGASTDNTIDILNEYGDRIVFNSKKDNGQADAINKGFQLGEGEIMGFLNSDDVLLPDTLHFVNEYFQSHPDIDVVYGNRLIINEKDEEVGKWILPPFNAEAVKYIDYIPQETLFWRKRVWNKLKYGLDDSFRFALDWDLIIRLMQVDAKFKHIPYFLGAFRYHMEQKTSSQMSNYGWNEFQRVRLHTLGKSVSLDETHYLIMQYRIKSAIYGWLLERGIR